MVTKIFEDEAGNKLFKKYIKTRDIDQFYGKNNDGKIIHKKGLKLLAERAGIEMKMNKGNKPGIYTIKARMIEPIIW